ncbi:CDP-2,3-bis-(O-geranylgeranyl)-sn-glycerol synthase [Candidatus Bathyarchaeota archaeon]|nr:CDP-2,3-bis-(O-geranylgeranyl)-sn-glycerol synthase [Candidatus Bathyarchaeota archaeon]
MELAQLFAEAFLFIFPAYCANAIPVIAGGGPPLDFGANFLDGRPIFGKNKTVRGFFSGLLAGTAVGFLESVVLGFPAEFGLLLSLGALFGDLAGAFVKRRLGLSPGDRLPVLDQISFAIGAILFSFHIDARISSVEFIVAVLAITPPIHLLTNFAAYRLGLKNDPW